MHDYPCMCLNLYGWLLFYITHCNSLSKGTIDCFLEKQKFDFFLQQLEVLDFVYCFRLNVFTSKILNLLLPLVAEEAGGYEYSPTNVILNKYIYVDFLMIYLSILFVLFDFLVLQRSFLKAVNRQSYTTVRESSRQYK